MMEWEEVSAHRIDLRIRPDLWNPIYASTGKGRVGKRWRRVTRIDREWKKEALGTWSVTVVFMGTGLRASVFIILKSFCDCEVGWSPSTELVTVLYACHWKIICNVKSHICTAVMQSGFIKIDTSFFKNRILLVYINSSYFVLQDLSPSCVRSANLQLLSWETPGTTWRDTSAWESTNATSVGELQRLTSWSKTSEKNSLL